MLDNLIGAPPQTDYPQDIFCDVVIDFGPTILCIGRQCQLLVQGVHKRFRQRQVP
ncbi:hypothetical protein G837_03885 [Escherichia coli HVH 185 (4-2876639)]|nr:hypothetical protein [Escherichia coli]EQT46909.1 hypothetical protein G837_03885 [Escherichia coli HVH 185 (4-2876639)]EQV64794.1 hypothetical protein G888_03759 [Escherichia coli KOEGE 58 (171a)]EQW48588.1 hypothetical protein G905_03945 [Escherichia coli UMEA 3087-1]EQW63347.1 hypothetical protein G909_03834 [Escherichia coli UMEA 3113-1]EQW75700.1 hypothetical protein G911_03971 [Escherichia coli UMEA 3121-1]EQY39166.1 hypothetical protein G949_04011 [Escherichia coli UMEA 3222-1]